MFSIGEKIVYPMHGAGMIESIEKKQLGNRLVDYYKVKILNGNITLLLPVDNTSNVQLRPVISEAEARRVLDSFEDIEPETEIPWNRRYKVNIDRLKSGTIENVATVLGELILREKMHGLSTSDRKMFILAKNIFCSEINAAIGMETTDIFDSILNKV